MKELLKKFIPKQLLYLYHFLMGFLAAVYYRFPSEKLVVIGVTGTNGKSTVVNLTAAILRQAGHKVGLTSTVNFSDGIQENLNNLKMTMPGRFFLQRMLRRMVNNGCDYAVLESSSEGVLQARHKNLHYDVMVFTNLAPEHLERHGGFEAYKRAKLEYFNQLGRSPQKQINGKKIPRTIIACGDDPAAKEFLNYRVEKKIVFGLADFFSGGAEALRAENSEMEPSGSRFIVRGQRFNIALPGKFNVENTLAAAAAAISQGVDLPDCVTALAKIKNVPGRMEQIVCGQDFKVLVDYAPEPNSLKALYEALAMWPKRHIIHVLGSTGGGRDRARRKILGNLAGLGADFVIVTNEDPYDEDPQAIIDQVAAGALEKGKLLGENLFCVMDRRMAIRKALSLANPGDLVLLTGKGAEQAIVLPRGRKIPWDERLVAREELEMYLKNKTGP